MLLRTYKWVLSKSSQIGPLVALQNANGPSRSIEIWPSHGFIGIAKYSIGRGEETETHVQEVMRLSPRGTSAYLWLGARGFAKLFSALTRRQLRRYDGPSTLTEAFRCIISVSPPPWRISVGSMKRGPRFRRV
jgi:hypothetical protein